MLVGFRLLSIMQGEVDTSKWIMVWPNYIDKAKSIPEGRRIAKAFCCKYNIHELTCMS